MGFAASSFAVNTVVGLASAVATARLFGVEVIGEYALVTAPWLLLIPFSSMAEQKALTRRLASVPARSPEVLTLTSVVLAFSFLLTSVVAVLVALFSTAALRGPIDRPDLVLPALVVLVGYVVVANTGWNLDAAFSGFRAGRELFVGRLLQVGGFPLIAALLRPFDASIWALTVATVASFVLSVAYRLAVMHRFLVWAPPLRAMRAGVGELRDLLGFGIRLLPGRLAAAVSGQAATWVLGATTTVGAVGAFSRANTIAVRLHEAAYRVNEIFFPALVERWREGGPRQLAELQHRALQVVALALFGSTTMAAAVSPGLLDVFGEGFDRAATAFVYLLLAAAVYVVHTVQQQVLLAADRPVLVSTVAIVRGVVTLAVLVPAAVAYGATGAGAALLAGETITWMVQTTVLSRVVGEGIGRTTTLLAARAAACAAAGLVVGRIVHDLLPQLLDTVVGAGVAGAVFVVVALALRWITSSEIATARSLLSRLRRGRGARAG